jgi:hypothetical protein
MQRDRAQSIDSLRAVLNALEEQLKDHPRDHELASVKALLLRRIKLLEYSAHMGNQTSNRRE